MKPGGSHRSLADTISQDWIVGVKAGTQASPAMVTIATLAECGKATINRFMPHEWFPADRAELTEGAVLEVRSSSPSWRRSGTGCHPS